MYYSHCGFVIMLMILTYSVSKLSVYFACWIHYNIIKIFCSYYCIYSHNFQVPYCTSFKKFCTWMEPVYFTILLAWPSKIGSNLAGIRNFSLCHCVWESVTTCLYSVSTRVSFPKGKTAEAWSWLLAPNLVPSLRMCGALPPIPLCVFVGCA